MTLGVIKLSVLLCTHNPDAEILERTLAALRAQTLPFPEWEWIVVDNGSVPPVSVALTGWHPHGRLVREERIGLTRARTRGIAEATGDVLVFCDDDNFLAPDYLARARAVFESTEKLGAAGGKVSSLHPTPLPIWGQTFARRHFWSDLGEEKLLASWRAIAPRDRTYPECAPTGSGLVIRRAIAEDYARCQEEVPSIPDRVGGRLSSGGDCAMVLAALRGGWDVGYFPGLELAHAIPARRMTLRYLARLNRASSESWVRLLAQHGICPWTSVARQTVLLRQARAFFRHRAWSGPEGYVRWAGACGLIAGRAGLRRDRASKRD